MIWLLVVIVCYWLALGGYAYRFLTNNIAKLRSYFRPRENLPEKYLPFYRDDFHLWDQKAILRNCFVHLPWKFFVLLSSVMLAVGFIYVIVGLEWLLKRRSPRLRKWFQLFMNYYGGKLIVHWLCPTKETNLNQAPTSPEPIIVSNHICWMEILYLVSAKWPISFLCKEEIQRTTLVGTVATFGDSLYVVRENQLNRDAVLNQIRERCAKVETGQLPPLLIFPEGTTANGKYLANFKRGAFEPMSRIKVFGLKYECENFNMAMDDMGQFCHVIFSLCQWPTLEIKILNDVRPQGNNADEYCQQVKDTMANIIGAKQPSSRFRDKQEFHKMLVEEFKNEQKRQ